MGCSSSKGSHPPDYEIAFNGDVAALGLGDVDRSSLPSHNIDGGTVAMTAQNAIASPLLRLPAELRNRIYEIVMGGLVISIKCDMIQTRSFETTFVLKGSISFPDSPAPTKVRWRDGQGYASVNLKTRYPEVLTLLQVCRQLRSETRELFYSANIFQFDDARAFSSFFTKIPPSGCNSVTQICIGTLFIPVPALRGAFPNLRRVFLSPEFLHKTAVLRPPYTRGETILGTLGVWNSMHEGLELVFLDAHDWPARKEDAVIVKVDLNTSIGAG